jgi:hypothetical protein
MVMLEITVVSPLGISAAAATPSGANHVGRMDRSFSRLGGVRHVAGAYQPQYRGNAHVQCRPRVYCGHRDG